MDFKVETEVRTMVECLFRTFGTAVKYGNDEVKSTSQYLNLMEQIVTMKNESDCREKALSSVINTVNNTDSEFDVDLLFEDEFTKFTSDFDIDQNVQYKDFKKHIKELAPSSTTPPESENDFIIEEESEVNFLDPLTKLQMRDPVRNTNCGHHYERKTILNWISANIDCKCPVPGCSKSTFITKDCLVDNYILKMRLRMTAENEEEN